MSAEMIILVLLIATALAFDFTNGFHDTGNAMATSIATGALKPKTAVLLAGVLNLVGAFLSVEVAVTVTTSVLKVQNPKTGNFGGHRRLDGADDHFCRPHRRHSVEPAHLAVRHSLQFVPCAVRRSDRRRSGRARDGRCQLEGRHREGADPGGCRAVYRRRRRRLWHLAGVPDHRKVLTAPRGGLPLGPDRHGLPGRARPRHQ